MFRINLLGCAVCVAVVCVSLVSAASADYIGRLENGDFEAGGSLDGWTPEGTAVLMWEGDNHYVYMSAGEFEEPGPGLDELMYTYMDGWVTQEVDIPADATKLRFRYKASGNAYIYVSLDPLDEAQSLDGTTWSWTWVMLDVSPHMRGTTATLELGCRPSGLGTSGNVGFDDVGFLPEPTSLSLLVLSGLALLRRRRGRA